MDFIKRTLLAAAFCTSPLFAAAEDFVFIEPGHYPRGHDHGRYGTFSRVFPLAIDAQYYGDDERPYHYVYITEPFSMAKHEVTLGEFKRFVEATGYTTEAERNGKGIVGWKPSDHDPNDWRRSPHDFTQDPQWTWRNPGFPQKDDHPVVGVSWNDAQAYCRWLSESQGATYRLPTEAEWEYAVRASDRPELFFWGNQPRGVIHRFANVGNVELEKIRPMAAQRHWLLDVEKDPEDGFPFTSPAGSFKPNAWGLHDMAGNAFEWCQDYYQSTFYDQWLPRRGPNPVAVDPLNDSEPDNEANEFRVIRGGSWYTGFMAARSSARGFFDAPEAAAYIGFRLVREATPEEKGRFPNPHQAYQDAVRLLEDAGARFSPINRSPQLHLQRMRLDLPLLRAIATVPGLERIYDLNAETWTQEMVDLLGTLHQAEYLTFAGGTELGSCDLTPLSRLPNLRELRFTHANALTSANLRQLAPLTTLEHFRVALGETDLDDDALRHLRANREISTIEVWGTSASGTFLDVFDGVFVRQVTLSPKTDSETGWTTEGSVTLARAIPRLENLSLDRQTFGDDALVPLHALDRLEGLSLSGCPNLTDAGIAALLAELPRIGRLNLNDTAAGPEVARKVPRLYFLRELYLPGAGIDDSLLIEIARSRSLRTLSLSALPEEATPGLTTRGVAALWRMPNLERVSLPKTQPLGPGIEDLAASETLKSITLRVESLTPELLQTLAKLKPLQALEVYSDPETFASWEGRIKEQLPDIQYRRR